VLSADQFCYREKRLGRRKKEKLKKSERERARRLKMEMS
jgi:hypothetical protein